jgi:hypothetical protein
MTSCSVVFAGTWLTDPTNPTVSVQVFKQTRTEQDVSGATVRTYAGGRRRIITTPSDVRTTPMVLQHVSAADVETLRALRGRLLLLRDFQGWRRWGMFADIAPVSVFRGSSAPLYTVALTWVDSDYSEAV